MALVACAGVCILGMPGAGVCFWRHADSACPDSAATEVPMELTCLMTQVEHAGPTACTLYSPSPF